LTPSSPATRCSGHGAAPKSTPPRTADRAELGRAGLTR
jgi:hypothetical protein